LQLDVRITISELRNELARFREECRSKETGRTPLEPAEPGSERQPQRLGTDDAQTFENRMAFFALLAALTIVSLALLWTVTSSVRRVNGSVRTVPSADLPSLIDALAALDAMASKRQKSPESRS